MVDVARGVRHMHERMRRVHLDMKPDNILIGADGRAVIADLGCSMLLGDLERASVLDVHGNAAFRAPELTQAQLDAQHVGNVLYSLKGPGGRRAGEAGSSRRAP